MPAGYTDHELSTHAVRQLRIEDHGDGLDSAIDEYIEEEPSNTVARPRRESSEPRHQPDIPCRSTESTSPSSTTSNSFNAFQSASSLRNRSPYSRSHLRSKSSAPAMTRSHSWAGNPATRTSDLNTSSTTSMRSPARARSPFSVHEETTLSSPPPKPWYDAHGGSAIESIQEDSELDLTPRGQATLSPPAPTFSRSSSLRRRPASPLHSVTSTASFSSSHTSDTYHSPALGPQRYNEAYPSLHHSASSSSFSSISSTPTSQRSRSPSISSLETIEDVPDLESAATEAERIEHLKLAAERAERAENGDDVDDGVRRRSLDAPRGFGFSRGGSRERKRWSVCGGERRADLDLETIWED